MGRFGARVARAALVSVMALVVAGCQWLYGYGYPYPIPNEPAPGPSATYATGNATITIGTEAAIELAHLTEGGTMVPGLGAGATFRSDDGWYVRIMGATKGGNAYMSPTFMTVERITDNHHWTTADPGRCSITITKADATGLVGQASCKGMRWVDAMSNGLGANYEPPYVEGQPPFDAEITFEALPSATQAG